MDLVAALLIAVAMALDCFSVAICIGTTGEQNDARAIFRLSFHFGLFQGGMALLGYLAGSSIVSLIEGVDHWVAFGLLTYVGASMIRAGLDPAQEAAGVCPSRGARLVILSIATSIDALAVGLSFALTGQPIGWPAFLIGITSLLFTIAGLLIGDRLGQRFGKWMEVVGGEILIGLGLRILLEHLFG